ncbi:MAG TPA: VCBS repeat-containing protein, partial [Armatimonadota bacterium]|nr:VCBS repeat-containing protein [Armatimonadota bacterium]
MTKLDYNSDGRADVALLIDDTICCLLQNSSGGFDGPVQLQALWAYSIAAGDVTGDGRDDLLYSVPWSQPDAAVGMHTQEGIGIPVMYPAYHYPQVMAVLDADGDGRKDVAAVHAG